jgi:hypothetical protein
MNDKDKKIIIMGAISLNLLTTSPFCVIYKDCSLAQVPDMPSGNEPSNKVIHAEGSFVVSAYSGTASSMTSAGVYLKR